MFLIAPRSDPRDAEGNVRCYIHHLLAAKRVSTTPANPGRKFYSCPKHRDDPDNCKFFIWADDPVFGEQPAPARQSTTTSTIATQDMSPRPSQKERASVARTPQRPTASSLKRSRSISPPMHALPPATPSRAPHSTAPGGLMTPSTPGTPSSAFTPSQKAIRIAAIQAGLDAKKSPSSLFEHVEHGSTEVQGRGKDADLPPSPKRRRVEGAGVDVSPSPSLIEVEVVDIGIQTDPIDEEELQRSFWEDDSFPARPAAGPSIPDRLPAAFPEQRTSQPPGRLLSPYARPLGGSQHSGLLTPPRSSQLLELDLGPPTSQPGMSQPETPTRSKGKGREINAPASQWQKIQDDVDNPYHARAAALQTPPRNNLPATPGTASAEPPLADAVAGVASELSNFSEPAQKSLEIKSKRITELESEIQRLRALNRTLEESAQASMARR
ncbi:hypothetical protein B0H21DRAFT_727596 [Amylocystis lapponica]|nr:hypothetical protein B0H21DRAFT_727596 [Amylocystis lapponica]